MQVCSTELFSMDQLSATSFTPVSHPLCSQSTTSQSGSPQRRIVILPARGSISPVKVATSPKRVLSPHVFTSGSGSPVPVCVAYTNCALVNNKSVVAVRNANMSDSAGICSSVFQCVSSTSHGINSEPDDRMLSTALHVDGILTSSSENASRHGIVAVACRESRVQETSVLSPVTSISRLPAPVSDGSHSVLPDSNVVVSLSRGHMHQSSSCVNQVTADKVSTTQVKLANRDVSLHHVVAVECTVPQTAPGTRTVSVTSIRKICPSTDAQKRSVVVKLFPEHSVSPDVHVAEQCPPVTVTSTLVRSPKRVVLLTSTTAESTNIAVCSASAMQQSTGYAASVNATATCQPCSSLRTVNLVVPTTANAVSVVSNSICHIAASSYPSHKVTESVALQSDGSQNSSVVVVGSAVSNSAAVQMPTENLSNGGTKSEDDSDDDSVVVIDADIEPSLPSPSPISKKRSSAAQNVILLNHHKSSSQCAVDSEHSSSNAITTDRIEQGRTKRKSALGNRLLESASDEGIILPVSLGSENGSRSSQPNRRKSFPQRRTDTSVPQLQFCTKQWKRDINYGRSTNASPICKHLQSRSPKKDVGSDLSDTADSSIKSEILLLQSNSEPYRNVCDGRKRKPVDHCESSTMQEVKRSKRLSPVKRGNTYCSKNTESADNVVHKAAAVDPGMISTSLSSQSIITDSSCSTDTTNTPRTVCHSEVKTAEPVSDSSSELQLLGKDKRSMEMSVTNEDGVVENLLVTIIDISSSEEEDNDGVEIHSLSCEKFDSLEVSLPEVVTSQSVVSKSVSSSAGSAVKRVQDKSCVNSRTLAPDHQPVSKSSCEIKPLRQKCRQTVQHTSMGRKVLVRRGRASLNDESVDVTNIKQVTRLFGKSDSQKRSKTDTTAGAVKQLKVDSDSASASSVGPIVRLRGSKHSPTSCCIVSGARDVHDETTERLKRKSIVLSSSCYPTSFQLLDSVPWRCIFCHQGSSYRTLGDLFGPYYSKTDDSTKHDSVKCQSSPSKSRSHSVKKSQGSGYVLVSQRRRQKLQKYAPPVAGKSPRKSLTSPHKGIPPEIWLHEDCAIWTNGICLSPTGQLCGLEAAITLSLQTVYLSYKVT